MKNVSANIRREVAALPEVFDLVGRFFAGDGSAPELRRTVEFVLEELFTNCVKYNPEGRDGIDISLAEAGEELQVTVVDSDSERFDIRTDAPVVDLSAPLEERKPGRLGVHLVRKLVDRVEYDYDDRVSTIRLFKSLR